jgi:predicted HicB family RNase H-like nuclease
MSAIMEYKGYHTVIDDFDQENGIFHGRVVDIRDVIDFQATSGPALVEAFHESIDDYLDWAAAEGFEPDRPFSGQFTVRITPQLHRLVAVAARAEGKSLNQWLTDLMAEAAARNAHPEPT